MFFLGFYALAGDEEKLFSLAFPHSFFIIWQLFFMAPYASYVALFLAEA